MGAIIRFPGRAHARASSRTTLPKGRGTSVGQSKSSGHLSENQAITSSYLRAVKVVAPASTRSKKRQSPAARRPKVVKLIDFAPAYADAQVMRFERSSDSMGSEISRSFPTLQAKKVGNFQLADIHEKSDKSAMTTVDQIRQKIARAIEAAGDKPIPLAIELDQERNYIRDYLEDKKRSLKAEVLMKISERYGIPINELMVKKEKPSRRRA